MAFTFTFYECFIWKLFKKVRKRLQTKSHSTSPTVIYKVLLKRVISLKLITHYDLPEPFSIEEIHEPIICSSMLVPKEFIGNVITLCEQKREGN